VHVDIGARRARRVLVVGSGGAGKSTLARLLSARTGLPLIHLDAHFWRAGWQPTPPEPWRSTVSRLAGEPEWIMDGNYTSTLDIRLPAADLIVFLDLPRRVTLTRLLRRRLRWHRRTRPEMGMGCPERLDRAFLRWVWRYPSDGRRRLLSAIADAGAEDRVVRLARRRDVRRWVKGNGRRGPGARY
jgi:adenylate kinase family enzyme